MRRRMLNPDFFTDPDIVANLDYAGRLFYQGLWCIAEDSGCFEPNPLMLKMKIFPGDDIPLNIIQDYIDKLTELGKIVLYKVGEKEYAWLKNFHRHQKLDRPSPPSIPLPDWLMFHGEEEFGKQRHKWYYEIIDNSETFRGNVGDSNTIEKNRKEMNRIEENRKEVEVEKERNSPISRVTDNDNDNSNNPFRYYQQNIGPLLPDIADLIHQYRKDLPDELITEAFKLAVKNNARSMRYAEKIMLSWIDKGIRTMEDYKRHEAEWEHRKAAEAGREEAPAKRQYTQAEIEAAARYIKRAVSRYEGNDVLGFIYSLGYPQEVADGAVKLLRERKELVV